MSRLNRRNFLKSSLAAGAVFAISGTKSSGNVLGANDRVRIAIAGLNGRGKSHMEEFGKMKDVEIAYLVDPDQAQFDRAVKRVRDSAGNSPKTVTDIRLALDDPSLHAVTIATPNHWHALMTIWACEAGKDVYVEKPCSHNVHEGRIAVEMAKKHDRIVQHGTQSRSSGRWRQIAELIKNGVYGKLNVAHGYCWKRRDSIGKSGNYDVPASVDYNLWSGPAEMASLTRPRFHYDWHWQWPYGNGDIGNQGVHQMDIARWGVGQTLPQSVISLGGRFGYKDAGETPNTQLAVFDFGEAQLIFEVRGLKSDRKVDNTFVLQEGTIADGKFHPKNGGKPQDLERVDYETGPGDGHFGNFIAAVRSRRQEDLNAHILEGHYSSALCHLANVSYQLGTETPFDSDAKVFRGNEYASETLQKIEEHLAKENGIKLTGLSYRLGRRLQVDPSNESIKDDQEANALLTRNYRKPFTVPDKVA
ncbi:MAG: Gfo/Idh/MocA family oxidoreductase [Planctomycetaceae bacterium]